MSCIMVLDLGSSSTRAIGYGEDARLIPGAIARKPFDFRMHADGSSEDNADLAVGRVTSVLDEMQTMPGPISAMGISSYVCSLVCLDEKQNPLTPVFTYADTRSAPDARLIREQLDEIAVLQRTGCRIRANYLPARIAWIRRTMPEVFERTRWFVSLSDYICLRLFGVMHAGISVWSWSGLLNRQTGGWDSAWLDYLGIRVEQLPQIAAQGEWLDGLLPNYAQRWPALRSVRCMPAFGDGAAANIGSGCSDEKRIAVTIGTTAAMRIVATQPADPLPPGLWCYRVDHERELIGGATTEGGNVFGWLRKVMQLPDIQPLEKAMALLAPDEHGLTILPLFAGERSPGFSENSRATLHGLTLDTSPVEIARACLEAIAMRLGLIYDELRRVANPNAILIASGGALLASPVWCQIIADVTGTPLHVCEEPEATSRGIAILLLERVLANPELVHALSERTELGVIFQPDDQRHAIYQDAMARQQALYARLH